MIYDSPVSPAPGGKITARWGRELLRSIRSTFPVSCPGMLFRKGVYGTTMRPIAQGGRIKTSISTSALTPFTVRWYDLNKDDAENPNPNNGEWQIYLPLGCATLTTYSTTGGGAAAFVITNDKAKDNKGEILDGWYKITAPVENKDDDVTEMEGKIARTWAVHLLMTPWGRLTATAMPSDNEFKKKQFLWDEIIGRIYIISYKEEGEEGVSSYVRRGSKGTKGSISKEWSSRGEWGIEYRYDDEDDAKNPQTMPKVYLVNQRRMVGRLDLFIDTETNITSWIGDVSIWVKIEHDSTQFKLSVARDLKGADAQSDDDKTVYLIYKLKDLVVLEDLRELRRIDVNTLFYTSANENPESSNN